MNIYRYVGPVDIQREARTQTPGTPILSRDDLARWLGENPEGTTEGATFVVDLAGRLRLAARRSEHVRCAGGEPVLAAGEIRFTLAASGPVVEEVSNQSTGYCPEPESWPAVAAVLAAIGVHAPEGYTREYVFRRCGACGQLNVVREGWYYCAVCDAPLPREWNVGRVR